MHAALIKRELLALNPMRIPGLIYWREHLASVPNMTRVIREHLQVAGVSYKD
jgi:hypothetical protein